MGKKATGIVAYITIIGWLIAFLAGDKEGAKLHLNQGLVLALAVIVNNLISMILGRIPVVGFIVGILCGIIGLLLFVLMIVGIIFAATDKDAELPVIGAIKILK